MASAFRAPSASDRILLLAAIVVLLSPRPAAADDKAECLASYVKAQELRKDGKLRASREQAAVCGRAVCPDQLRNDCVTWVRELDESLPSIVPSVRTREGVELTSARVLVDGQPMPDALDGRAHTIDPGRHVLRAEASGFVPQEQEVLVHEGEHDRPIRIILEPKAPASAVAPPPSPRERSILPVAIPAAVGAAGLGVFATFGLWGYYGSPGYQSLGSCKGHCAQSDVDTVANRFLVSNIGLAVAAAGVAVATIVWLVQRHGAEPSSGAAPAAVGVHGFALTF
jgi:hypothetical protein